MRGFGGGGKGMREERERGRCKNLTRELKEGDTETTIVFFVHFFFLLNLYMLHTKPPGGKVVFFFQTQSSAVDAACFDLCTTRGWLFLTLCEGRRCSELHKSRFEGNFLTFCQAAFGWFLCSRLECLLGSCFRAHYTKIFNRNKNILL